MSKINQKSIDLGLKILLILALSFLFLPGLVSAEGGRNYTFGTNNYVSRDIYTKPAVVNNPKPNIKFISPDEGSRSAGMETITVTGSGFIPSSAVRINGINRPTTFIDGSHLLVQANLNEAYRTEDGFFVTVWNSAPGGGYSNAVFFSLKGNAPLANDNNYGNDGYYGGVENGNGYDSNGSSLASSVILGENSFLPSGLIQWVMLAIIILFIIILARRVFGAKEYYDDTPLKHA